MTEFAGYRLEEFLGESNHGLYYRARPSTDRRRPPVMAPEAPLRNGGVPLEAAHGQGREEVAIKILVDHASDAQFRCLAKEVQVLSGLDSPWIVHFLDASHVDGRLYYTMEYMEMGTLARRSRPLSDPECIRAVMHGARGLHLLHGMGLVHRDFKPAKILVHEMGGKLNDLGISDWLLETTRTRVPTGSIGFMAPEIARGEPASTASDIFAIGATIHQVLTGRSIHENVPRHHLLAAIRFVGHEPPVIAPELSPGLEALVRRCIAAAPEARPASSEAVADRLEEMLTSEEAFTVPSSPTSEI